MYAEHLVPSGYDVQNVSSVKSSDVESVNSPYVIYIFGAVKIYFKFF
ncbi:hypothetical protein SAMN05428947_10279 [Mucilaginibacter sp. OK283]|jgi:hypothetical protein|nr:hypothetical protein SAMN05428947_10279 [Mucilaginibacter sp. OK283]